MPQAALNEEKEDVVEPGWRKIVQPKMNEVALGELALAYNDLKIMKDGQLIDGVLINHPRFLIR